jgi:protein-tyrosine phosphatase
MAHPNESLVDLHSHLVPGVDDGSASVAETLACLRALRAEGVGRVVTTPHLLLPRLATDAAIERVLDEHRRAFERVVTAADGRDDLPAFGLGQEIWAPDAAAVRRVVGRRDVGLAGSRYLLVEFGFDLQGTHLDVVRAVLEAGRGVVIAHPERYSYLPGTDPLGTMRRWQEAGALLQVNAGSLAGHYAPAAQALAWEMVGAGLVDLVATDHHGVRREGVSLREAFDRLVSEGERALAERAMAELPRQVARDEPAGHCAARAPAG